MSHNHVHEGRVGYAPQTVLSREEHRKWATSLWRRMDRDMSDTITSAELACEEFELALHSILAPDTVGSGVVDYGRSSKNAEQAICFCLRNADKNADEAMSFAEFETYLCALRNEKHKVNLVFTMFDLDNDGRLSRAEFHEVYRYFNGRNPTEVDFERDWSELDAGGSQYADRQQFAKWMNSTQTPIFKQDAPSVVEVVSQEAAGAREVAASESGTAAAAGDDVEVMPVGTAPQFDLAATSSDLILPPAAGSALSPDQAASIRSLAEASIFNQTASSSRGFTKEMLRARAESRRRLHPLHQSQPYRITPTDSFGQPVVQLVVPAHTAVWNERHHHKDSLNDLKPKGQRQYFSSPQSHLELKRHLSTRDLRSSRSVLQYMEMPEVPSTRRTPLTCDVAPICPERHVLGGTMQDADGMDRIWNDRWHSSFSLLNDGVHPDHRNYFTQNSLFETSPAQQYRRFLHQKVLYQDADSGETKTRWTSIFAKKQARFPPLGGRLRGRSGSPVPDARFAGASGTM